MHYAIALHEGSWCVRSSITGQIVVGGLTSEDAQQRASGLNARTRSRRVDPSAEVWTRVGRLHAWVEHDGWWGLVDTPTGVRWIRADDLRPD